MATVLTIPAVAFDPGGVLATYATTKLAMRIPISVPLSRADTPYPYYSANYTATSTVQYSRSGILIVTLAGVSVDNTEFANAGKSYKNLIAEYITKGMVVVKIDGVTKTAAEIRAL